MLDLSAKYNKMFDMKYLYAKCKQFSVYKFKKENTKPKEIKKGKILLKPYVLLVRYVRAFNMLYSRDFSIQWVFFTQAYTRLSCTK